MWQRCMLQSRMGGDFGVLGGLFQLCPQSNHLRLL
nr:unnamed protein product [Callosobruchus chinensis]